MRIFIRTIFVAGALALAGAASLAEASSQRGVDVVNKNFSVSIQQVWSAPAGTDMPWRAANLSEPIGPRSTSHFSMPAGSTCFYDMKVQFSDDVVQTFSNVNVCRNDRVVAD